MAAQRKRTMTLAEHDAQLKAEGRYDAMISTFRQMEEARLAWDAELARAEAPLVEDLKRVGWNVQSVWDLVNTSKPYPEAVPILLDHLQRPYPKRIREGIGRALAVPEAKVGWHVLLDMFKRDDNQTGQGAKSGLASALAASADDEVLDDLIDIVRDPRHRSYTLFFVKAFARSSNPRAREMLAKLSADPEVGTEVQKEFRRVSRGRTHRGMPRGH